MIIDKLHLFENGVIKELQLVTGRLNLGSYEASFQRIEGDIEQ
jgi:hypothetical protein